MDNPAELPKDYLVMSCQGYKVLKLIGNLAGSDPKEFRKEIQGLTEEEPVPIVVNCEHLSALSMNWLRILVELAKKLKEKNLQMRIIRATSEIQRFIRDEGLDQILPLSPGLRDALVSFGIATKKMLDVDFINPFLRATIQTLKVQAHANCTPGKMYVKQEKDKYSGDVSGVIGLVSDSFNGAVVLTFPEATFLKLISKMLGENYSEINREIIDGAGELTNIIFGQAKIILNEIGFGIKSAIPSVVCGKNHSVSNISNGPSVVVPFESDFGPFYVEISVTC